MAEYEALKSKMQKRIGNTPLYSYKMSSRLCNLQQNLSSKHSKDSKINISNRSLGKPTGIKLYSLLKKKSKEEIYFDNYASHQAKGHQNIQKENNSFSAYSIANFCLRDHCHSKLSKDK